MVLLQFYNSRLNNDTLNALLVTNEFYKKEKLLGNEKDVAKQKLSSKSAKAAETTETVEAGFRDIHIECSKQFK